jgi:hypothetical protein
VIVRYVEHPRAERPRQSVIDLAGIVSLAVRRFDRLCGVLASSLLRCQNSAMFATHPPDVAVL